MNPLKALIAMKYLGFFLCFLFLGVPVIFALLLSCGIDLALNNQTRFYAMLMQRWISGIDNFPIMALPLFILAGEVMNAGGITLRIVRFAETLVGHFRGGLSYVCVLSSVILSGGSGSAVADASAMGSMLIPPMEKMGYPRAFSASVVAASGILAPIIPPSTLMIVFSFSQNVSVAAMFIGGVVPGLMLAGAIMLAIAYKARQGVFPPVKPRASARERFDAFRAGLLPIGTPVILMACIIGGLTTPTEAAAIAVVYATVVGMFYTKELTFKGLTQVIGSATYGAAKILIIVGVAMAFASVVSLRQTPQMVSELVIQITDNPHILFLIVNVLLLVVGCVIDATPAILILAPILAPAMHEVGIHPIHFGVVMVVNLAIGLLTPPMGMVLFVTSGISRLSITTIAHAMAPIFVGLITVLLLITFFPVLVLGLPEFMGLI